MIYFISHLFFTLRVRPMEASDLSASGGLVQNTGSNLQPLTRFLPPSHFPLAR